MARTQSDEGARTIDDAVGVLFRLVSESLGWATHALLDQDYDEARRVIDGDIDIDRQCEEVTASIRQAMAEPTPDPETVEQLVAILQIVPELERSADLAKHIAQRSSEGLGGVITPRSRGLIQSMSEVALEMWHMAGQAYLTRSRDTAFEIAESDSELDKLCAALVTEGTDRADDPKVAVDLALIARFYERLGDHAVNLSRRVGDMAAPRRLTVPATAGRAGPTPSRGLFGGLRNRLNRLRLIPRDNEFFDYFSDAAANARSCADELGKLFSSFSDVEEHFDRVRQHERRGDEITVEVLRLLDASFVPPFDREDVHKLVEELDDVVDDMFAAASLTQVIHVTSPLPDVVEQTELLVTMADEMEALVQCLRHRQGARFHLERIEQLEHQGDAVFRRAMGRLFGGEYDAIEILKWKDVVQSVEDAMNAIEAVSDVVESILIKDS